MSETLSDYVREVLRKALEPIETIDQTYLAIRELRETTTGDVQRRLRAIEDDLLAKSRFYKDMAAEALELLPEAKRLD